MFIHGCIHICVYMVRRNAKSQICTGIQQNKHRRPSLRAALLLQRVPAHWIQRSFLHLFCISHFTIFSFMHAFIHPSVHSFMHAFMHSFIHPFIHAFILIHSHSFTCSRSLRPAALAAFPFFGISGLSILCCWSICAGSCDVCMLIRMCVCSYVCQYVCVCVHVRLCVCACVCVCARGHGNDEASPCA